MANDFDELISGLPGGENPLAELFGQVTGSLASLVEKTRRLGDAFDAVAPAVPPRAGAERPAAGGPLPAPTPPGVQAIPGGGPRGPDRDGLAAENTRANQQTARAVEELVRGGIKLRELPPATYAE